ncbi:lipopolysaccharide biosynthesis protein [Qipengyuania qiaonensis]|uniref:Lipopolysaccharide biosynthesis protein n=1 Tax=Qipengyuania qiaonensis TaxID=2867240 RepID=A0ABS7JBV6_9SPHN|nr:lipopolysaccharide biosynthesis protein [Qipengyuania qiaonensis]MBX7483450.1 lipopolysaccharide biosynthesis protein [Qipengyuania qiaonensis]
MTTIASRMLSGSAWLSGARIVTNILSFVSTIVLARLLAPADFGIVALGTTLMAILSSITEISLSQALIQHRNPTEEHFHTAWTLNGLRGIVLALIMCGAAWPMAIIYEDNRLIPVVCVMAIGVVISGLGNPRRIMFQKKLIFWQEFLLLVTNRVTMVVSTIWLAIVWDSYWALIVGVLLGQLVQTLVSYAILPFLPRPGLNHARELWSFSVWLTLGQAINTINWRFDQLLVGGLLGNATLGHYAVGSNLAQVPTRETTNPIRQTLFPALSQIADDPPRLRQGYQRAQALITLVALPMGIGVALVADTLVLAAMGSKWLPAVPIIQALSVIFAVQTIGSMVSSLGMARGHTKLLFVRDLQMFFIRLPIIVAGTLMFGLAGLIGARVISGLIGTFVNMLVVRQLVQLGVWEQLAVNIRSLVSAAAMAVVVLLFQRTAGLADGTLMQAVLDIAANAALGAVVYIAANLLLWRLAGRPNGPETELIGMAAKVIRRLVPGRA